MTADLMLYVQRIVRGVIRAYHLHGEDDDLLQDVYVRVMMYLPSMDTKRNLFSYITQIAKHEAGKRSRDEGVRHRLHKRLYAERRTSP